MSNCIVQLWNLIKCRMHKCTVPWWQTKSPNWRQRSDDWPYSNSSIIHTLCLIEYFLVFFLCRRYLLLMKKLKVWRVVPGVSWLRFKSAYRVLWEAEPQSYMGPTYIRNWGSTALGPQSPWPRRAEMPSQPLQVHCLAGDRRTYCKALHECITPPKIIYLCDPDSEWDYHNTNLNSSWLEFNLAIYR